MADDRNPERGNQERPEQDPMKREDPSRELGYESPKKPGDFDQPDTADDDEDEGMEQPQGDENPLRNRDH